MIDTPPSPLRRALLLAGLAGCCGTGNATDLKARTLVFPRDFGSHPDTRTEWWYITGYASSGATGTAGAADAGARLFGFQITFFRSRVDGTQDMQSSFAAKQLLFAHAAITDVQGKKLWHDQRMARSTGASDIKAAAASEKDTAIRLRDWSLVRKGNE